MAQRARLTWDRNQDRETNHYRVYRSLIAGVTRQDQLIMKVAQPEHPNPIQRTERLIKIGPTRYRFPHKTLLPEPIEIRVNDQVITSGYTIDEKAGEVIFDTPPVGGPVTATYTFDGIEVYDHDGTQPMEGVTWFGPVAYDQTPPATPLNVVLIANDRMGRVELTWEPGPSTGTVYYYRVEAVDHDGRVSKLSSEQSVRLFDNLAGAPYIVERSRDGGKTWEQAIRTHKDKYVEPYEGLGSVAPVTHVDAQLTLNAASGTADVKMTWLPPAVQQILSPVYRVRAVSKNQFVSEPSPIVGPVQISSVDRIVIRRKIWDGSYPSFDGSDAVTVTELTPQDANFTDRVADETTWIYAIYVAGQGHYSAPAYIKVTLGDVTDPNAVRLVEIEQAQP